MAGSTTNTDILAGVNQLIQAINDLVLVSNCTPAVSVTCSCGTDGSDPPSDPGTEGGAPPDGWEDTDDPPGSPEYNDRKCKIANMLHEQYRGYMQEWSNNGVDIITAAGIVAAITLIAELATPFPLIDGVIGAVLGITTALAIILLNESVDLDNLINLMDANQTDLVCALYNSSGSQVAQDDYIDILETAGAQTGTIILLRAALAIDALNYLFFKKDEAIEASLANYTPPIDCGSCGAPITATITGGTLIAGSTTSGDMTIQGEFYTGLPPSHYLCAVIWSGQTDVDTEITGWVNVPHTGSDFRAWENGTVIIDQDTPPVLTLLDCKSIDFRSNDENTTFRFQWTP